jgi:hypothetical protein
MEVLGRCGALSQGSPSNQRATFCVLASSALTQCLLAPAGYLARGGDLGLTSALWGFFSSVFGIVRPSKFWKSTSFWP